MGVDDQLQGWLKPRPLEVGDTAISGEEYLLAALRECIDDTVAGTVDAEVNADVDIPSGRLPARAYFRLDKAAGHLGCDADDLLHFAAQGLIRLGVKPPFLHAHIIKIEEEAKWVRHIFPSYSLLTLTADDVARIEGFGETWLASIVDTVTESDRNGRIYDVEVWYGIEKSKQFSVRSEHLFIGADEVNRIESGSIGDRVGISSSRIGGGAVATEEDAITEVLSVDSPPPGWQSTVGSSKVAIKAAWEIEQKNGRLALAREVMDLLREWAVLGCEPAVLIEPSKSRFGVQWRTSKGVAKCFDIEACGKTIRKWHKSRAL